MGEVYSKFAELQQSYNLKAVKPVSDMIVEMHKDYPEVFASPNPFRIADLGCFDAVFSLPIIVEFIGIIRKINPTKPIEIYLNDTPYNDITKAINNVTQELKNYEGIYVYGCARSFYYPLFPEGSMDFIYSLTAVQVVSEKPPGVHPLWQYFRTKVLPPPTEGEIKWIELAKKDWVTFLNLREAELKPYGRLFIGTHCVADEGSNQEKYMVTLMSRIKNALRDLLKKYGWEEYEQKLTMPAYYRSLEEYELPIKEGKTSFKLKKVEYHSHPDFGQVKLKSSEEEAVKFLNNWARIYLKIFGNPICGEPKEKEFHNDFIEIFTKTYLDFIKSLNEEYIYYSIGLHFHK